MTLKTGLWASIAATALATSAFAQNAAAPGQTPPAAAAASNSLAEVVVTANRRAENVQNVPITVSAVSGAQLVSAGVTNVLDIKSIVPGANVVNSNGFINAHLRGVGNSNPGPGIEPSVAFYVDGVYYASTLGVDLDLADAQEVEVLKGPQGTLFGRNATGGLIQITTRDPTQRPALDAEIGYGDYDTTKANLYVAGGLTDNLAANLSLQASHQGDGYGTNFYNGKPVNRTDGDIQSRSKLVWTPASDTRVTAVFDYSQVRADIPFRLEPGSAPGGPTGPAYGGTPWDTDNDATSDRFVETGGASLKAEQDLSFVRLSDIVAYRQTFARQTFDLDSTPTPFQVVAGTVGERQFSEEFQAQSPKGSGLKWTAGLYYFDDIGQAFPFGVAFTSPIPALNPIYPANSVELTAKQDTTSIAGYGQASAEILPATNLTVGARYTSEDHRLTAIETADINNVAVAMAGPPVNATKSFSKPTFRIALDHRFSKQVLTYVSYNTGFKSGGFNPLALDSAPFLPETLVAYEAGVKTNFLDNRIRADLSAFYYDYKDIQVQELTNGGTAIQNGAGAHVSGLDFDFAANVTHALTLHGGFEYLHDRFTTFLNAPISQPGNAPVVSGSASGDRLPLAPDAVVDLGGEYQFDPVFGGALTASFAYVYNTGYYTEIDNVQHQSAFSELNGSLRWKSADRHYSASLWANNITSAAVAAFGTTETYGTHQDEYTPPRTFGVTVGYHY